MTFRLMFVVLLVAAPVHTGARQSDAANVVTSLVDSYDRGDYAAMDRMLASRDKAPLARAFTNAANQWISRAPVDGRVRRRQVAAAVALEIVSAGFAAEWGSLVPLIEVGCALTRQTPAGSPSEMAWHMFAIALLQGGSAGGSSKLHARDHFSVHVQERVPDSAHIKLASAFEQEMQANVGRRSFGAVSYFDPDAPPASSVARAAEVPLASYRALVDHAVVGAEANVRLGALLIQLHKWAEAIPHLAAASRSHDPFIKYLAAFLTGQAQRRLGDTLRAEHAYREALVAVPGGMSASLALASLLSSAGRWANADEVMVQASRTSESHDPWRLLPHGSYRHMRHWQTNLREHLRR